jgi:hypothetical protein
LILDPDSYVTIFVAHNKLPLPHLILIGQHTRLSKIGLIVDLHQRQHLESLNQDHHVRKEDQLEASISVFLAETDSQGASISIHYFEVFFSGNVLA